MSHENELWRWCPACKRYWIPDKTKNDGKGYRYANYQIPAYIILNCGCDLK